jgi:hypothetical protein
MVENLEKSKQNKINQFWAYIPKIGTIHTKDQTNTNTQKLSERKKNQNA